MAKKARAVFEFQCSLFSWYINLLLFTWIRQKISMHYATSRPSDQIECCVKIMTNKQIKKLRVTSYSPTSEQTSPTFSERGDISKQDVFGIAKTVVS